MKPKLELNLIATIYGGPGRYHPAIRNLEWDLWYWPNITFPTETEAHEWAKDALRRLTGNNPIERMQQEINKWNIHQL